MADHKMQIIAGGGNNRQTLVVVIVLGLFCLTRLFNWQHRFTFATQPTDAATFNNTEINGGLNYVEYKNGHVRFSILKIPNLFFDTRLTSPADSTGATFIKYAAIGDTVIKHRNADTLWLLSNSGRLNWQIAR